MRAVFELGNTVFAKGAELRLLKPPAWDVLISHRQEAVQCRIADRMESR
jgi:hypothetical protein